MATIKTTLGALVDAERHLGKALATKFDKSGGEKVRYHAVKLMRLVGTELKHYHDERNAFIEERGTGEPRMISTEAPEFAEYVAFDRRLRAIPVEISWGPLTETMLAPYPDVTGETWVGLGPLFLLDEEAAEESVTK
jgi:hypothetical protein